MLLLISRVLGLFSMKSKGRLFMLFGILMALAYVYPNILEPFAARLSVGARIDRITKLNSMDKAKIKEPLLKESYSRIVSDVATKAKPFEVQERKARLKFMERFGKSNIGYFLTGAALWFLLGIVGLLSVDDKLGARIGVFFVFLAIGIGSGLAAGSLPMIKPMSLFIIMVLAVELFTVSLVGTLSRDMHS